MGERSAFVQGEKRVYGRGRAVRSLLEDGTACEVQERAGVQPMHGPNHQSGHRLRCIDSDQHCNIKPVVISDILAGVKIPDRHIKNRLRLSRPAQATVIFYPLTTDHLHKIFRSPFPTFQEKQVQNFRRERIRRGHRKRRRRVHAKGRPVVIRTNLLNLKVQVSQQHC